ncbi:hypothetical protein [Sediminitomix flava]|uniref:hypothetical protein n=1 Tax=Sediminitomix flava TaxID=379075 RepID=UPI000D6B0B91|nr:hypothetical protein [Sediminitomix flava]
MKNEAKNQVPFNRSPHKSAQAPRDGTNSPPMRVCGLFATKAEKRGWWGVRFLCGLIFFGSFLLSRKEMNTTIRISNTISTVYEWKIKPFSFVQLLSTMT